MKLGIICGRFQTAELTAGHKQLIKIVSEENDQYIVFIGVSPARNTKNEPLTYGCRRLMITNYIFDSALNEVLTPQKISIPEVFPISDIGNLPVWCGHLDELIDDYVSKNLCEYPEITIYGGRDSVATHYTGKYQTKLIDDVPGVSATNAREQLYKASHSDIVGSFGFRAGMIFASQWRFPTGFPTADVACIKGSALLLCQKPNRDKFNLIGGFFDPTLDKSLEDTALRELKEESGIVGKDPKYMGSFLIEHDYRYKRDIDKIVTTLFMIDWVSGDGVANDDVVSLQWMELHDLVGNIEKYIEIDHIKSVNTLLHNLNL